MATTPLLEPLAEENGVNMVQYNLLEFEQGWDDYAIETLPTLFHIEKGAEISRIEGQQTEEDFQSLLENYVLN